MIPTGNTLENTTVEEVQEPSLTWKLDFEKGRIMGNVNGLDAVKQSVSCILNTERYKHLIYSFDYGVELESLIGQSPLLVRSELTRRINDALLQDDRIQGIENMDVVVVGDQITASFTVLSDYGSFSYDMEVT